MKKSPYKQIKIITIFLMIQIVLVMLLLRICHERKLVKYTDTERAAFVADKIERVENIEFRYNIAKDPINVYYEKIKYKITLDYCLDYTTKELIDNMSGQMLTILYEKDTMEIVELQINKTMYFSLADYNFEQQMQLILGVVTFIILEVSLIIVFVIYLRFKRW